MKQSNAMIAIDATNLFKGERKHNWKIDYRKLKEYFEKRYSIIQSNYYDGYPTFSLEKHRIKGLTHEKFSEMKQRVDYKFKKIQDSGWKIIKKPVSFVIDSSKVIPKCNFDVEITIDAIDNIYNFDTFILGSGDGDFTPLVGYLKNNGKNVIVFSWRDRLSTDLRKSTPNIIKIGSLKKNIQLPEKYK